MPRLPHFLRALSLGFLVSAAAAAIPFPHEGSDLKPDPATTFGTLPNGLRYVIRANREPKDRAALRLLVEAGSLHEQDDQQGLAHFLEHMAFNGSVHYAPGTLTKFFQRMGMNFGGDTNASTSFDRTLYLIELPDTRPATVAEGLQVFSDYAGGLLLTTEEIDRERGVILSEMRARDSVSYRTFKARYEFTLGGTLYPRRLPIGETAVIQHAGREKFVAFYDAWYRPELMAVVVIGDVDPAAVQRQITDTFSPLRARAKALPAPDKGQVPAFTGARVFHHYEAEAPNTSVSLGTIVPYNREPDTAAQRLKLLPRLLAHQMLNRRLSIRAKEENAPFSSGRAAAYESDGFYRQTSIGLTCRGDQWSAALGVAEQELRRALEHGFQKPELIEAVANFRNRLEQAVRGAATRRSDALADEIADALLDREVWTTPADDLALYGPALETVTPDACADALRRAWSPAHRLVMVTGNAQIADGGEAVAAITTAYEKSCAAAVAAPAVVAEAKWAYENFGPPGTVARREHIADLDVTLLTFANGVRLNLKRTDFEADRIRLNVRVGSGQLTEPVDQPGLGLYADQTFSAGGLGRHSSDDLRTILAGRTVGAGFSVGGDAFILGGATNRADLLLEMQLIAARITDPGFRPEAARQVRKWIDQVYLSFAHTAGGPFNLEIARLLAGGDSRFGLPAKEEMLRRNLDEVKAWLLPELQRGAIEIAIVGDLDVEATIAAVGRTLGALPTRAPKPELAERRRVAFPAEPFTREFAIETEIPKGQIAIYWPTTDGREVQRARRLNVLGEVLNDRLREKVREELGDAYSPNIHSVAGDLYPGYGYYHAAVTVDPPRAAQVADIVVQIAEDLAKNGVTAEELERAKKPILTSLRESARTNPYWLGSVLSRAQEKPAVLDWARSRYADHEAISTAELSQFAQAYLGQRRASRVTILPKNSGATEGKAPAEGQTRPRPAK